VEGRLHGVSPQEVHLHELGGHDTVVDVVGVCAALQDLGVDQLHSMPVPLGRGGVRTDHGVLPVPAPATAELLAGAVLVGSDLPGETVTPTAAALLATLGVRWEPAPPFLAGRTGYGSGTRRLADRPNVAVVRLGTTVGVDDQLLTELTTTVDDASGETLGYTLERLLDAGALDVWITPAVMKKSRPGHVLHVLSRPTDAAALQQVALRETGSLGIRAATVRRLALPREQASVEVDGHLIGIKRGPYGAKPEHEDVAAAARALDLPLREMARRAAEEASRGH
jgi:uncharacterized protein (TIGR00299 family) protein